METMWAEYNCWYEVSCDGNIRNSLTKQELAQNINGGGYNYVTLQYPTK